MAVRIALQCNEADSQLILGDNNAAARLLSPGRVRRFTTMSADWSKATARFRWPGCLTTSASTFLKAVQEKARNTPGNWQSPIVFEGNAAAPITKNTALMQVLDNASPPVTLAPTAWLGDPVAIKAPTAVAFRRQSGANMLLIGQQDEAAMALLSASLIGLAAQYAPDNVTFYVMDGSPADSPLAQVFPSIKAALPHDLRLVDYRGVTDAIDSLATELATRQVGEPNAGKDIFLFIYGLQRYRTLRKAEDDFSFSMSASEDPDAKKPPNTGKQFADLMRDGPVYGIHILGWADTPVSIERTLDRSAMREFDNRILFQMSANDSSNLIDSPAANKLGPNRALAYSEEQGTMEKFRPYALPDKEWLGMLKEKLGKRAALFPAAVVQPVG